MRRFVVIVWVIVRNALRGLQSSPLPSAIAVMTIAIALVLVGSFALVIGNMEGLLERFSEELHVVAYLDNGLSARDQLALDPVEVHVRSSFSRNTKNNKNI